MIDAAGLKHSVLIGWSYAGQVISDYLATHGAGQVAGINFVDAPIKADPALIGDNLENLPPMASDDPITNISATRNFLHGYFSKQPTADDHETMLAFNMMVLPKVRAGLSGRPLDATEMMSKLKLPVLVTHGAEDRNAKLGAGQYTASPERSFPFMKASVIPRFTRTLRASTPNWRLSSAPPPKLTDRLRSNIRACAD